MGKQFPRKGDEMAKRYYNDGDLGGMIKEDKSAMCNLPQNVIIKKYPSVDGFSSENLNDGMGGVDSQMKKDNSAKKAGLQPEKV